MTIEISKAVVWTKLTTENVYCMEETNIRVSASLVDADWKISDGKLQLRAMEGLSEAKLWAERYAREHGLL